MSSRVRHPSSAHRSEYCWSESPKVRFREFALFRILWRNSEGICQDPGMFPHAQLTCTAVWNCLWESGKNVLLFMSTMSTMSTMPTWLYHMCSLSGDRCSSRITPCLQGAKMTIVCSRRTPRLIDFYKTLVPVLERCHIAIHEKHVCVVNSERVM